MAASRLKRLRSLFVELPQQLRLAYCLARDPRTPAAPKTALGAALAVILNPLVDIPIWIPVLGQMDTLGLALLAVRTFNSQVPAELRAEVEGEIRRRESVFDRDLAQGVGAAQRLARTVTALGRLRRSGSAPEAPPPPASWYRSPAGQEAGQAALPPGPAPEETSN